jgi:hypothetical protein
MVRRWRWTGEDHHEKTDKRIRTGKDRRKRQRTGGYGQEKKDRRKKWRCWTGEYKYANMNRRKWREEDGEEDGQEKWRWTGANRQEKRNIIWWTGEDGQ